MNTLIQTEKCSIIYGDFKGKPNQELFRCPRELDDIDLARYIDESRTFVGFCDDIETEDIYDVPGMKCVYYYRLYYRDGQWWGKFLPPGNNKNNDGVTENWGFIPDVFDCKGIDEIVEWLRETFPKGCNWAMKDYFAKNHTVWGTGERYLVRPLYSSFYKVMIDTTYGNGDYPVRIYVYHKIGKEQ